MPESVFPKWLLILAWLHVIIGVAVMVIGFADPVHFVECYVVGLLVAVVGAAARRGRRWSRFALLGIHLLLLIALPACWMVFFYQNAQPASGPEGLGRIAVGVFGFRVFAASLVVVPLSGFTIWRLCRPGVSEHFTAARAPFRLSLAGGVIGLGLFALLVFGIKSQVDHSGEIIFIESLDLKWRVRPQEEMAFRRRIATSRSIGVKFGRWIADVETGDPEATRRLLEDINDSDHREERAILRKTLIHVAHSGKLESPTLYNTRGRAAAAEALANYINDKDVGVTTALLALLEDPDPSVRVSAIETLGRSQGVTHAALPQLLAHLRDLDPNVRREAANALTSGIKGIATSQNWQLPAWSKFVPVLIDILGRDPESPGDSHEELRLAALEALKRIGPAAQEALPTLAKHQPTTTRKSVKP